MSSATRSKPGDAQRRASWLRIDAAGVIAVVLVLLQGLFYYTRKDVQQEETTKAVARFESSLKEQGDKIDKAIPAAKDEVKQYVKERDDMRADQIRRLEEDVRRRGQETSDQFKEMRGLFSNVEARIPVDTRIRK